MQVDKRLASARGPRAGGNPATSDCSVAKSPGLPACVVEKGFRLRGVFSSCMAGHDDSTVPSIGVF